MPTTNNVDNGMDYNQQYHSHGSDHNTSQYPPSHSSQTTTSKRQQSSQTPRETREGSDERRANSSAPPPFKELGSGTTRVLSSDKGPSPNEVPGPHPAKPTKTKETVRPGHESSERQGVGSSEELVSVEKDATTTEHSDRHGARSSSRAEGAISGSRETRAKSWAQVVKPESTGSKSSGNSRSTGKEPPVQETTRSSGSGSPTKHPSSHLPQGPTDPRHAQRSTQGEARTSRSDSSAKRTNEHLSDGPTDKRHGQPPFDYNSGDRDRDREHSGYPKQKVDSSEEARRQASDSSGSSDLETMGPSAQINPSEMPLPPDLNQQARSQQQYQHQQQQQVQQQQLQAAQQEEPRFANKFWKGATSFLGGQPKDKALADAEMQINYLQEDLQRERSEHGRRKAKYRDLEHENARLKENLRTLQHELYNNQRELQEAKSLSDIRGRELQGAQVFLTKADSLSMSDVIEKVSNLNEEIFQAAALFAEGIHPQKYENIAIGTIEEYQQQTCRALGERMTQLLIDQGLRSDANSEVHPLIGQSVISGCLVYFCNSKLNSWFPSESRISEFLSQVYGQMRQHEEQAVSGRWRALVHAQIRPSTDEWRNELFKKLEALLVISSWNAPQEAKQAFESKVGPIFKALEDLRAAIYEKFTSADLHAFIPDPDGPFQTWMEDAYGDDRNARTSVDGSETVAGTTAIGLRQVQPGRREETYICVIPPKVFLYSTLKEALEPPPPTKGRSRKRAEVQEGGRT